MFQKRGRLIVIRAPGRGPPDNSLHGGSDWRFSILDFQHHFRADIFLPTWRQRQLPAAYSDRTCYRAIQRSADFRCNRLLPAVCALFIALFLCQGCPFRRGEMPAFNIMRGETVSGNLSLPHNFMGNNIAIQPQFNGFAYFRVGKRCRSIIYFIIEYA